MDKRLPLILFLAALACACLAILWPLLSALAWAAILAYVSWPLYRVVRRLCGRFEGLAALGMTTLMTCAVVVPVLGLTMLLSRELMDLYRSADAQLATQRIVVPDGIRGIPWLGDRIQEQVERLSGEPMGLARQAGEWARAWSGELGALAGGVGRGLGELFLVLFSVYFFYRDGERVLTGTRAAIARTFGDRLDAYLATAGAMTRAVMFGFLATAFAQGAIAGVGYAILGVSGAALLGGLTGLLSFVPLVGTALVWGSLAAWLIATGHIVKGVILVSWGFLIVHPTDNVLRPLLISNSTHVPFIVVTFGVLGGLALWGLVGVFAGPIVLAVGLAIWREWVNSA